MAFLSQSTGFRNAHNSRVAADHKKARPHATAAAVVLLVLVFFNGAISHAQTTVLTEYQVKAAFLYNFAKFVEWPPQSFANQRLPFKSASWGGMILARNSRL